MAISVENRKNFPTPFYFASPLKGFPSELGIGAGGQKTRMMGLPDRQSSLTIWRLDRMHKRDRQTDGHRATAKTALTRSVAQ